MELGGFAETKEDIDGTEEDFIAFNYCLAEDYLSAIVAEDFEQLGEVGIDTIESVVYWLNYYEEDQAKALEIEKIPKGQYITGNNRTLEEAVIENEDLPFAEVLIYNGNLNPRLFLIVIQKADLGWCEEKSTILNLGLKGKSKEECIEFLRFIFDYLEQEYLGLDSFIKKKAFLQQIKPYIKGISLPKSYYNDEKVKEFIKTRYTWQNEMNT